MRKKTKTLAGDFFAAQMELERLYEMVEDRVEEILGRVYSSVGGCPTDEQLGISGCPVSLSLSPAVQEQIYALGFKRILMSRVDKTVHYYYQGGRPEGYVHKTSVKT